MINSNNLSGLLLFVDLKKPLTKLNGLLCLNACVSLILVLASYPGLKYYITTFHHVLLQASNYRLAKGNLPQCPLYLPRCLSQNYDAYGNLWPSPFYTPEGSYYGMASIRPLANSCADNSSFIVL